MAKKRTNYKRGFGKNWRILRELFGFKTEVLARKLGISKSTISEIENEKLFPTDKQLKKYMEAFPEYNGNPIPLEFFKGEISTLVPQYEETNRLTGLSDDAIKTLNELENHDYTTEIIADKEDVFDYDDNVFTPETRYTRMLKIHGTLLLNVLNNGIKSTSSPIFLLCYYLSQLNVLDAAYRKVYINNQPIDGDESAKYTLNRLKKEILLTKGVINTIVNNMINKAIGSLESKQEYVTPPIEVPSELFNTRDEIIKQKKAHNEINNSDVPIVTLQEVLEIAQREAEEEYEYEAYNDSLNNYSDDSTDTSLEDRVTYDTLMDNIYNDFCQLPQGLQMKLLSQLLNIASCIASDLSKKTKHESNENPQEGDDDP